jgi:hypothetical protein
VSNTSTWTSTNDFFGCRVPDIQAVGGSTLNNAKIQSNNTYSNTYPNLAGTITFNNGTIDLSGGLWSDSTWQHNGTFKMYLDGMNIVRCQVTAPLITNFATATDLFVWNSGDYEGNKTDNLFYNVNGDSTYYTYDQVKLSGVVGGYIDPTNVTLNGMHWI